MADNGWLDVNKGANTPNEIISMAAASHKPEAAPLNLQFVEYQKNKTLDQTNQSKGGHKTGFVPSPVSLNNINQMYTVNLNSPAYYDLRTMNKLTPVKDQGNSGCCWAFASYGSLESYLLPNQTRDFSENNM
jgi:C1A family cysteine protease